MTPSFNTRDGPLACLRSSSQITVPGHMGLGDWSWVRSCATASTLFGPSGVCPCCVMHFFLHWLWSMESQFSPRYVAYSLLVLCWTMSIGYWCNAYTMRFRSKTKKIEMRFRSKTKKIDSSCKPATQLKLWLCYSQRLEMRWKSSGLKSESFIQSEKKKKLLTPCTEHTYLHITGSNHE